MPSPASACSRLHDLRILLDITYADSSAAAATVWNSNRAEILRLVDNNNITSAWRMNELLFSAFNALRQTQNFRHLPSRNAEAFFSMVQQLTSQVLQLLALRSRGIREMYTYNLVSLTFFVQWSFLVFTQATREITTWWSWRWELLPPEMTREIDQAENDWLVSSLLVKFTLLNQSKLRRGAFKKRLSHFLSFS